MKIKCELRPLTRADAVLFPETLDLLNRTQGRDLFAPDYLDKLVETHDALAVGAFCDKKLVGIGVVQIITDFSYYLPFDSEISKKLSNKKVAQFSTLAIDESMQGKGVGQQISGERLKWVASQNCDVIIGVSWVSGRAHTSNRVFEKMGFKAQARVENFYKEWSIKKPFDCPGCNAKPCACAAIFYLREC